MQITNDTTTYQVAELMGTEADEIDGRIMLGLLSRLCVVDTDEISAAKWESMLDESQRIRANLDARVADEMADRRLGRE